MLPHYELALQKALNWIKVSYNPVGIVVSGSIVRGNPNPNSDFDIYVLHKDRFRQRIQRYFEGVPVEIFVNSFEHVYQSFEADRKNNRPVTAHILSTGKIYLGETDPEILQLIAKAEEYVKIPVKAGAEQLIQQKYSIALLFEDATESIADEPETASHILDKAVGEIISFTFLVHKQPLPRLKERLYTLAGVDAVVGKLVYEYYRCSHVNEKQKLVADMLLALQIPDKFFEWSSPKSD